MTFCKFFISASCENNTATALIFFRPDPNHQYFLPAYWFIHSPFMGMAESYKAGLFWASEPSDKNEIKQSALYVSRQPVHAYSAERNAVSEKPVSVSIDFIFRCSSIQITTNSLPALATLHGTGFEVLFKNDYYENTEPFLLYISPYHLFIWL